MQNTWALGLICGLAFWGCSDPTSDGPLEDSLAVDSLPDDSLYAPRLAQFPLWVQVLVWKEEGAFRTFQFGEHIAEVRHREVAKHVESREGEMLFTVAFNPEENVDLLYQFGPDSLINAIDATLFLRSPERRDSIFAELSEYYTDRIGKPGYPSNKETRWRYLDEYALTARREGNHLVHAIAVEIRPVKAD